jgi:hypothetical protein
MLIEIDTTPPTLGEPGLRWWSGETFVIGWKGHFGFDDHEAGPSSVAALASALETAPLASLCGRTLGVFGLFVWDRRRCSWQAVCDNAGLYKVFHDDVRFGTDFLQLARERKSRAAEADPAALLEYVTHGGIFGGRTFLPLVRELGAQEILHLTRSAVGTPAVQIVTKDLREPDSIEPEFLIDYFDQLAASLKGLRVSLDVTGGFDSRLIAALLSRYGLPFEAAMSGEPDSPDVLLAREVAGALGVPFFATHQDLDRLEAELPQIVLDGGGLTDVYKFHRDRQIALGRLARGIEVFLHGGAGALYKDFFVHHEFPLYGRRKASLERFYDLRVAPIGLPAALLAPTGQELARELRARTLRCFARHRAATNNETYDRVSFFVRVPEDYGHQLSSYINLGLPVIAPLAEHRNAVRVIKLSAWARFMHGYHRQLITRYHPHLARLPTTDGYSASSAARELPANLIGYGRNELRRLISKTSQRLLGRRLLAKPGADRINAAGFVDRLRATPQFEGALALFKERGILAPAARAEQVRDLHVGRVLTAGMSLAQLR